MSPENPIFTLPEPHTKLMRYMCYAKFAYLLYRRALYFAPISSLDDQYEGTLPHPYSAIGLTAQIDYGDISDDERRRAEEVHRTHREVMRRCTMINSWCLSEHESISMWDRYAPTDGLAVSTDVKALLAGFLGNDTVQIGEVHYINYDREVFRLGLGQAFNAFIPFLHKRREYADEREIRAIVSDLVEKPDTLSLTHQPVDLGVLIQELVVSPEAGDWLIPLLTDDLKRNGLDAPVRRSTLSRIPTY